jgi:hypothetical protein
VACACLQVETQVKLDKNEKFVASLGAFHADAKAQFEEISKMKEKADETSTAMLKWLGEDAKVRRCLAWPGLSWLGWSRLDSG